MGRLCFARPVKALWLVCALVYAGALGEGCTPLLPVPCDPPISAALTANRYQLFDAEGPEGEASLQVLPLSGEPPYSYSWYVLDPAGVRADHLVDATHSAAPRFTAGRVDGPYDVYCTVTDSRGCTYTGKLVLLVGTSVGLDVTTERFGVVAGGGELGQTTIHLTPEGGTPPYEVTWTVTGPDGNVDNARLAITDPLAPVFVSGDEVGTYILTATIVDATGTTSVQSVIVVVGQHLGLDVVVSRTSVLPGGGSNGMARLLATPIGGKEPYVYDWEVIGPDDQQHNELLWDTNIRSPVFESGDVQGSYVARCAVRDAEGKVMIGSTTIMVGQQLGMGVTADRLTLAPGGGSGGRAVLSAEIWGGRQPITIRWSVAGPGEQDATDRLSSRNANQVVFTSSGTVGTYVVRCTAVDADGGSAADALTLTVGGTLDVLVTADKSSVAAGGAAQLGTAKLTAYVYGGTSPFSYTWTVTDSSGNAASNLLDSTIISTPTFTSTTTSDVYTVFCTVSDAAGSVAMDAVNIEVGQPLNADTTADRQVLVEGGGIGGQAQLSTTVHGGVVPYTYQWSVFAPDGSSDPARLSSTTAANPIFTSTMTTGTYQLTITVTDALGAVFSDSVELVVSSPLVGADLSLDVTTSRQALAPGGSTAALEAVATGGVAPLTYAWTVTAPSGATDNSRIDSTTNSTVTFTSSGVLGTYRVSCTVTDGGGNTFTDSIQIDVTDMFLIDVTASVTSLASGGTVNLSADRTGGSANFTYVWRCVNSAGTAAGTFTTGSTGVGAATHSGADDVTNAWTAPAVASGASETYRITCVTTDSQGAVFSDSVHVVVEAGDLLTVQLTANTVLVGPGEAVSLSADQTGGVANFNYAWTATDSSGTPKGSFTTGSAGVGTAAQNNEGGDVTNTWTAPASGTGTLDTYRIEVVVTDASSKTFRDTVHIIVDRAFSLNVTASDTFVAPSTAVTLVADQTGGETTYSYVWSAVNSSGTASGTFTVGSAGAGAATQGGLAGDATNTWSVAATGTYTIRCTVTDNVGQVFTDSIAVVVTTLDLFSLDVVADKAVVRPGETVNLTGDQTGGTATFNYTWQALNESGASSGAFGAANQSGQAGDVTNTWQAPSGTGVEGTYRIRCTITDASGNTFIDTVLVEVSTLALQNVFLAPVAADTTSILGVTDFTAPSAGADPGQQIAAGFTNPSHSRNVVITITDGNNSINNGTVRVTGLNARGEVQSEIIAVPASAGGTSTSTGAVAFATVTQIDLYSFNGVTTFPPIQVDKLSIGVGNKFGLTGVLDAASDVVFVNEGGTVITSGYTVDATAGQQGITFANAPNGVRDYIVVFRAR